MYLNLLSEERMLSEIFKDIDKKITGLLKKIKNEEEYLQEINHIQKSLPIEITKTSLFNIYLSKWRHQFFSSKNCIQNLK